ncbi:hypothetical protein [Streptomyces griseoviridis]|uniref:Minor tail protein n=1 Tax=Streptomyces griseoviridis TaxID=45398 RepID=A0ABT9LIP0_STRGD|nr:hypothetical protein [Streptomyces griseoviridis]MDP9682356.1 hypothetical protein [Streptomyces griseoviridis]GGS82058.1 hypothetical protein GCM10010240_14300 [Streptomyces griseoviridis]
MTVDMGAVTALLAAEETPEHTYTYLFCDLRTDTLLAELPLASVSYTYELNGIGTLRATIPYNDETLPLDPETASVPGRTAVYVDRDGVLVWGGIVWTRDRTTGGKTIQAAEFLSYFQHRYVKKTLSTDTSLLTNPAYVDQGGQRLYSDQKYIVWSLLRYAQDQAGGSIGLNLDLLTSPAHGITRMATYYGYERPEIYKAIAELAAADDGFDFGVELGWTSSANNVAPQRYRRVRAWYPRRGRTAAESGLVFSTGGGHGSILSYDWPEAGTTVTTEMSGLGGGTGEARIVKTATATDMIGAGWPLLESVETWDGLLDEAQVQSLTNAELSARSQANTAPTFEVSADTDPQFGSYQVGDEALFVIDPEPLMPTGREGVLRIVSMENTSASGPERVRLTCAAV